MPDKPAVSIGDDLFKVVAFDLAGQRFCIDILSVREIRGWSQTTPLPHAPDFVRGLINLRGAVLPVIDLAARLGFPCSEPTARHGVIITEMPDGQLLGLLVETVSDILEMPQETIQTTPEIASDETKDFVRGVVAKDAQILTILSVDKLAPTAQCVPVFA